ncbi:MAG TPA: prephenate dehydrogenase [Aggregatilineales bacterium]|nr:prephenate dehydrogenase [Anaerolineales bacterium]HRE48261.1 prephenate dehydrogenase [Aggregatilineales bacterium]
MKALPDAEVCIVGTGLMGTSLAKALRGYVRRLVGSDLSAVNRAAAAPSFDALYTDLTPLANADLIVLAIPVRAILSLLGKLPTIPVKAGALILDIGGTKTDITAAMNRLPETVFAIGGHPMCGKETSGPGDADGGLFVGCPFVLCPTERTTSDALTVARALVEVIRARAILLDPTTHDRAIAAISHLPYLVSASLVGAVMELAEETPAAWELAASGFRDTSRLAVSDVKMKGDALLTNRTAVIAALNALRTEIDMLHALLTSSDDVALREKMESVRTARNTWAERAERTGKQP